MKEQLEESQKQISERTRKLFLAEKQIREDILKVESLQNRVSRLEKEKESLQEKESQTQKRLEEEYRVAVEVLRKDLEKLTKDNQTLKSKLALYVAKLESVRKRENNPELDKAPLSSRSSGLDAHTVEEVQTLQQTIRFLRQELAEIRNRDLIRSIQTNLPPLEVPTLPTPTPSSTSSPRPSALVPLNQLAGEVSRLSRSCLQIKASASLVDLSSKKSARQSSQQLPLQVHQLQLDTARTRRRLESLTPSLLPSPFLDAPAPSLSPALISSLSSPSSTTTTTPSTSSGSSSSAASTTTTTTSASTPSPRPPRSMAAVVAMLTAGGGANMGLSMVESKKMGVSVTPSTNYLRTLAATTHIFESETSEEVPQDSRLLARIHIPTANRTESCVVSQQRKLVVDRNQFLKIHSIFAS
eukprot:TRINITY_DN2510_c0_g1_i1.p1 TRINITY_DN2510_c0_g1~~TRINITY_DN2510_c0_g1_i1.p1  ORF type:complete len:458 (+),score=168.44 TRINITY_DN2510_c0_g1_i1:136-1374(+)